MCFANLKGAVGLIMVKASDILQPCGLKVLVPEALSSRVLELLAYAALSYKCMRPEATSVCGLELKRPY